MTTVSDKVIETNKTKSIVARWRKLSEQRSVIDHEMAVLAKEIRDEFPDTASGDHQFKVWVKEHLEVKGTRATALLTAARALKFAPEQDTWKTVGGYPTMSFVLGVKSSMRRKVLTAALDRAKELGRPAISAHAVRHLAFQMGATTMRRHGRPTRTKTEENVNVLRLYIAKLHEEYKLPAPPQPVLDAMAKTKLEVIRRQINDASQAEAKREAEAGETPTLSNLPDRAKRVQEALAAHGD